MAVGHKSPQRFIHQGIPEGAEGAEDAPHMGYLRLRHILSPMLVGAPWSPMGEVGVGAEVGHLYLSVADSSLVRCQI